MTGTERVHPHAHLWRQTQTLLGLGELMALWLEGTITYQPGYMRGAGPDEETADLVEVLAAVNRAGYFTTCSQPGVPFQGAEAQRAAVEGFCDEEIAARIQAALLPTDLVLFLAPPHSGRGVQICVTMDNGEPFTWIGGALTDESIDHLFAPDLQPAALAALHGAWQVTILDPHWGRNDVLWPALRQALDC